MSKRRSFKQKREQADKQLFVGREEPLRVFEENLRLGPDHDDFLNIFNIYGQGGVGKTTLGRQYQLMAKKAGYYISEVDCEDLRWYEVTATMNQVAEDFARQGTPFKRFSKRYKDYLEKKRDLEADPECPKRTFGSTLKGEINVGTRAGVELIAGGNLPPDNLPIDPTTASVREWVEFVHRKLGRNEEVELVLHQLQVLAPLWLEDLHDCTEEHYAAIFFDTYEVANPQLDNWLYDLLDDKYGQCPYKIILSISGRKPLDRARWEDLSNYCAKISLEPFSEEETRNYLVKRGLSHEKIIEAILSLSNCLPVYLSLLAEGEPASPDDLIDPNEKIVERFLKHIKEPLQRQLALQAALPRKLNEDVIACLLEKDKYSKPLFKWLKERPFVEKRGGHWTYHPEVRMIMLRYQKEISATEWEAFHLKLSQWYDIRATRLDTQENPDKKFEDENWLGLQVEKHYHQLCVNFNEYLPDFIRLFVRLIRLRQSSSLVPIITVLSQVDQRNQWSDILSRGTASLLAGESDGVLEMFQALNNSNFIINKFDKSEFYFAEGIYEPDNNKKIECYNKAIELNPNHAGAYNNRAVTLDFLGHKPEALADYNIAIKLNPNDPAAFNNRAAILDLLDRKAEALDDYNRSIQLNPNDANIFNNRGVVLDDLGCKEDALDDFNAAIELNPKHSTVYSNRGAVLDDLGYKEKALADYNIAIELNPNDASDYNSRGNVLYDLDHKEEALESYSKAIALNSKYPNAYFNRGKLLNELNRKVEALADFNKAIELNPDDASAYYNRGSIFDSLDRKTEAIADYNIAIELNPEYAIAYYNRGNVLNKLDRKAEALADYTKSINLNPAAPAAYLFRGNLYEERKDYKHAMEDYEKLVSLKPDLSLGWSKLGWAALLLHQLERSEVAFLKVWDLENQAGSYNPPMNVGHIHLLRDNTLKALEWYQQAIKLCPDPETLEKFWEVMQQDYHDLRMQSKGITPEAYEKIIKQLKQENET